MGAAWKLMDEIMKDRKRAGKIPRVLSTDDDIALTYRFISTHFSVYFLLLVISIVFFFPYLHAQGLLTRSPDEKPIFHI